jgi:hypothetical protein
MLVGMNDRSSGWDVLCTSGLESFGAKKQDSTPPTVSSVHPILYVSRL